MSTERRTLTDAEPRCFPDPNCPLKAGCARYTVGLPQGVAGVIVNYRDKVQGGWVPSCEKQLSVMFSEAELEDIAAAAKAKALKRAEARQA